MTDRDREERTAIQRAMTVAFNEWADSEPRDVMELSTALNAAAARAKRTVKERDCA